jgi:hypothetical protein
MGSARRGTVGLGRKRKELREAPHPEKWLYAFVMRLVRVFRDILHEGAGEKMRRRISRAEFACAAAPTRESDFKTLGPRDGKANLRARVSAPSKGGAPGNNENPTRTSSIRP